MEIENIVLDMDLTLLNDEQKISVENDQILKKAFNKGINVICNTGRHHSYAKQYLLPYNNGFPCVFCAGALIYDIKKEEVIKSWKIKNDTYKQIINVTSAFDFPFLGQSEHGVYYSYNNISLFRLQKNPLFPNVAKHFVLYEEGTKMEDILKFSITIDPKRKNEYLNALPKNNDYEYAMSADKFLDITPKGINKASALQYMANNLGLDLDKTLVFGDNENDSTMFDIAKYKCCPNNAIDEIKKKADFISCSNNDSAISFAINNFYKDKI